MKKRCLLFFVFIVVMVISGCAESRIVEKLGFAHSIAFDLNDSRKSEDDDILIQTVEMPQITETAESQREVLTVTANTSKEAMMKIAKKSDRQIVSGQLRTVLIGESLARLGIADTLDTLFRDHEIGLNVIVITVKGSAKQLLDVDYKEHPRTSRYIYEMIKNDKKIQTSVDTTIHHFVRDYYDDGIDPITPLLKKSGNDVEVDGIALFRDDQFVEHISWKESRVFLMLHEDYTGGNLTIDVNLQGETKERYTYMTFNTISSKRKITVDNSKTPRRVRIDLKVSGTIDEYTGGLDLTDDHIQKEIEKKLEEHIKNVAETIVKKLQANKVDSLGIGQYVRNSLSYKEWKKLNWREEFPNVEIEINVKSDIKNFGMVK